MYVCVCVSVCKRACVYVGINVYFAFENCLAGIARHYNSAYFLISKYILSLKKGLKTRIPFDTRGNVSISSSFNHMNKVADFSISNYDIIASDFMFKK